MISRPESFAKYLLSSDTTSSFHLFPADGGGDWSGDDLAELVAVFQVLGRIGGDVSQGEMSNDVLSIG
jgi:hypothetical protein